MYALLEVIYLDINREKLEGKTVNKKNTLGNDSLDSFLDKDKNVTKDGEVTYAKISFKREIDEETENSHEIYDMTKGNSTDNYDDSYYEYRSLRKKLEYNRRAYVDRYKATNVKEDKLEKEIKWMLGTIIAGLLLFIIATKIGEGLTQDGNPITLVFGGFGTILGICGVIAALMCVDGLVRRVYYYRIIMGKVSDSIKYYEKGYVSIVKERQICLKYINLIEDILRDNKKAGEVTDALLEEMRKLSVYKEKEEGRVMKKEGILDLFLIIVIFGGLWFYISVMGFR